MYNTIPEKYSIRKTCKNKNITMNNYKKTEINAIFLELLDELLKLFHKKSGGFSYFQNQSQNYYYGVPLGKGGNQADLHGTMLCLWALIMVLENSGLNTEKFNVIKP